MTLFDIPLLMVVTFLLLTLAIGLYFSRKKTTLREYAIGNKQFTTATLVATVLASAYSGGGLIRTVEMVHKTGLYWIIIMVTSGLGSWYISVLALRMGPFMEHLSMPDTIGRVYGKWPRVVVAVSSILEYIAIIAIQISVMSKTLITYLGFGNSKLVTIFATLLLIFYSTFGGVRAVLFTDVLQFATFVMIIPLISCFLFLNTGKTLEEVISFLSTQEKFQFTTLLNTTEPLAGASLILSFAASYIGPWCVQRVYMSSGPIQAKRAWIYATFFDFIILSFIISIGVFVFYVAPALPQEDVWSYIMTHIPSIFKGLIAVSILAMAMSTADSRLNVCAVIFGHDILQSIRGEKEIFYLHSLRIARLATLSVGLAAMILVFYTNDLLKLLLLALNFSLPIMVAPFILAVYGFRSSSRTALIGMATGMLTIIIWNKWIQPTTSIDGSFICIVANGLAMLFANYLLPQPEGSGWVGPDDEFRQVQQAKKRKRKRNKAERAEFMLPLLVMIAIIVLTGIICALCKFYGLALKGDK